MADEQFRRWREVYESLYGEAADRALFELHCARASSLIARGAPALPPFDALQVAQDSFPATTGHGAVPQSIRRLLGEFYTPDWLADFVLDQAGYTGSGTLLDPTCGEGVFLKRANARGGAARGFDINPLAVMTARLDGVDVELRDAAAIADGPRFDFVTGNPPWVNWRRLGPQYRDRIGPLWQKYGLFTHTGLAARLGSGMDDLSVLLTYICADNYVTEGGRLAFVLPQTLFQSAGGGRGFRRFELPDGRFLRVLSVHDLSHSQPFRGAATRTAVAVFEVSRTPTMYPVAYFKAGEECAAAPITSDRTAPWSIVRNASVDMHRMRGQSPYIARIGAHSGGAAGVFWVDVVDHTATGLIVTNRGDAGRTAYATITAEIEPGLVHRLMRGRDVERWRAHPSTHIVLPHHENGRPISLEEMARRWPKTFAYFEHFRERMLDRPHYRQHFAASGLPYWSMYNVGAYTFAPHRVVWREQSAMFQCAMLPDSSVIPDAKLILVPCRSDDEAHYLAAVLNSTQARGFIESYMVRTQISTHVLKNLRVPLYDGSNALHQRLAELSRAAHQNPADAPEIDAAELWE